MTRYLRLAGITKAYVAALTAICDQIAALTERITQALNAHPDKEIAARAKTILIEPGIGGRWLEVWDESTGEGYELGRVLVWEPGERVVLSYRNVHLPPGDTEVEVRFEPIGTATRVTLEHRGIAEMSEAQRANAWLNFMAWFREYAEGT